MNPLALNASLGQDQFLRLLVTQLQNQDPLNPVSDREFVDQLATLSQLQGIQSLNTQIGNLNTSFGEMLKLQQLAEGSSLIGKTVSFTATKTDGTTETRNGAVSSVVAEGSSFVLTVGTDRVPLANVASVKA